MNKITMINLVRGLCLTAAAGFSSAFAHDMTGTLSAGAIGFTTGSSSKTNGVACTNVTSLGCGPLGGAVDTWQITCEFDSSLSQNFTDHLFVQIADTNPAGGPITALAGSDVAVVSTTDLIPATTAATPTTPATGDLNPSPGRIVKSSIPSVDATYTVIVHHTSPAADSYTLSVHCQDANNNHTGTKIPVLLQDQ